MSTKVTDRKINLIKYNHKINLGGKLMGWAKYDEDIREIVEERKRYCKVNDSYDCVTRHLSRTAPSYTSQSNRTANHSSFYIKYSTGTVRY